MLKDNESFVFNIVGSGSDLERCKNLAGALKLKNVIFHGRKPLSEMPGFYKMADAMLITLRDSKSFSYTLPGKVQSYMAAGKAIIAAANGETERVINEAGCGFCCPAEDYEGLSRKLLHFYQLKDRTAFARNSRKYYDQHFSKDNFMIALEQALTDLESGANV
jgi:glycosyltransferase involved in cell wall biosynthesis